ncbi:hypothetical protein JRO89_XS03G0230900 [Xanthoceras sorbifolium]|uniref:Uncharacterized protein n=1 Tax=Xanthoceras sorbifolium TaxID=99658 RepID=A0ABQ8IBC7_9ROSI|nr:hypothetical protein JRO89_XS03G0230900 [Xanthoceras sorbifolium]
MHTQTQSVVIMVMETPSNSLKEPCLNRSRHVACEKLVDDDHASKFCFRQVVVGCIELSSSRARPRDGRNNYGSRHVKPTRKGLHAWRGRELSAAKDDFPAIHVSID